ncbi:DUF1549 and DUF1553 domain-containing protein [Anatilimnocola floriformis]|uniref:DUF1549 and DUF1553 domain-containing protein n=1 Tax=Anatilimnocola floriformis TaxID=2948575 RepID=UPI0020C3C081|nr:DUF1549 and DUF1553 domain-containing protein [Anatilimnocola floriformis]
MKLCQAIALFCGLVLIASSVRAADPAQLAERIDAELAKGWQRAGVQPAKGVDDGTFLRRVYLDLVGRIPTVAETQAFLDDAQPNKRARLTEQLINSGGYARHFATVWRRIWVPQTDTQEFARLSNEFEAWAAVRLRDNVSYDKLVEELLLASRTRQANSAQDLQQAVNPIGFQAASLFRAENLAANTTRAFLGLNLDCAQCHDHPFSRWTRNQFWETAAFFAAPQMDAESKRDVLEVKIPETEKVMRPKLLNDRVPEFPTSIAPDSGRKELSKWIIERENPYFARNAVNRLWANFFGYGLVEPLDDLSDDNPSSNPELHQALADAFVASGYDLKFLTQALVQTRAYQLSTISSGTTPPPELRLFERMPVRGLSGEQLYDSLVVAAALPSVRKDLLSGREGNRREQFASLLHIERAVAAERSIVQSLTLMNGTLVQELTKSETSPLLAAATDSPFLSTAEKVEMLFYGALNRRPTADETKTLLTYVTSKDDDRTETAALADVLWVLLNSSEFNTNH